MVVYYLKWSALFFWLFFVEKFDSKDNRHYETVEIHTYLYLSFDVEKLVKITTETTGYLQLNIELHWSSTFTS